MPLCPILETKRLILRGHEVSDLEAALALWTDPLVTRFITGKPASRSEVWSRILRYSGHWALLGYGYWAIEEKASGGFVGELGFADFKRDLDPSIDQDPEIGWALASSAQGKGYGTEALQAALGWGKANLDAKRFVCIIDPRNLASIHLAQKCGFYEIIRTTYAGSPTIIFEKKIP